MASTWLPGQQFLASREAMDWWSLGVLLSEVLCGREVHPLVGDDAGQVRSHVGVGVAGVLSVCSAHAHAACARVRVWVCLLGVCARLVCFVHACDVPACERVG